jgi:hemolysin III
VLALPGLYGALGPVGFALVVSGGVLYTTGAIIYARRSPDPIPAVFGYHEVFHAFVIAAALCHFVVVAGWALPSAS